MSLAVKPMRLALIVVLAPAVELAARSPAYRIHTRTRAPGTMERLLCKTPVDHIVLSEGESQGQRRKKAR